MNFTPWSNIAAVYAKSFEILKNLNCDVFLGPHARFYDMETKIRQLDSYPKSNPFVDPGGYRLYIARFEKLYNEQLQREQHSR